MLNNLSENNKKLIESFKTLNLPKGKYVIFGSGSMLIRNLKDGHDLDILVTHDLFQEYKNKEDWKLKPCNQDFYLSKDGMELWETWRPGEWNTEELINNAEYIDNMAFVPLETTAKWKRINGREKDLQHVKIIEDFLAKQQQ